MALFSPDVWSGPPVDLSIGRRWRDGRWERLPAAPFEEILRPGLTASSLLLKGREDLATLPPDLACGRLDATDCTGLAEVGRGLFCHDLSLANTAIETLPDDIRVVLRLDLSDCRRLRRLPDDLHVGSLDLSGCVALEALPRGLRVSFLDLTGCTALKALPEDLEIRHGRLSVRDCPLLETIPAGIGPISQLDLAGCLNIVDLPESLAVTSWIDLAGSGLTGLPPSLDDVHIHWRDVPVDARIAFRPETMSPTEILDEPNAERRRVMMERFGFDRLFDTVEAEELDRDRDPGGERRLLRLRIEGDEDLVCVSVRCPSTGRHYVLRVPPTMRTCRQAIAWTAGFDDPAAYLPLSET